MGTSQMRLAVMSLPWGNPHGEELEPWLREVRAAGYEGIAGVPEWGWLDYLEDGERFRTRLEECDLELAALNVKVQPDFDLFRRVCQFAAVTGCRHLVLFGGRGRQDRDVSALAALLDRIGEVAADSGVRAVYHNHTRTTGETFTDMDRLLSATDPTKVRVMLDIGHATKDFVELPAHQRVTRFLEKYWDRLDYLEFKDWHPDTDLATCVGEGICDWEAVFSLLRERNYRGWITVEQNAASAGRTVADCVRVSREFIRSGLGI
jgi:sugar phosphate isomerase/epimerase